MVVVGVEQDWNHLLVLKVQIHMLKGCLLHSSIVVYGRSFAGGLPNSTGIEIVG